MCSKTYLAIGVQTENVRHFNIIEDCVTEEHHHLNMVPKYMTVYNYTNTTAF